MATAREGETPAPPVDVLRSLAPLILLPAAGLLGSLGIVLGGIAMIVGAALLWTAPHWRSRDKIIGTVTAGPVPVAFAGIALSAAGTSPLDSELVAFVAPGVLIPVAASVYLWRTGRRVPS
ncbi:hypothetical protein [Streptomyces sp. NPDC007074]|uniref:hypothetical protein n=1 Tax=Streptomyces sp. NPDC007074 TaxID=3156764 RepID=UPI0033E8FDCD